MNKIILPIITGVAGAAIGYFVGVKLTEKKYSNEVATKVDAVEKYWKEKAMGMQLEYGHIQNELEEIKKFNAVEAVKNYGENVFDINDLEELPEENTSMQCEVMYCETEETIPLEAETFEWVEYDYSSVYDKMTDQDWVEVPRSSRWMFGDADRLKNHFEALYQQNEGYENNLYIVNYTLEKIFVITDFGDEIRL